jgi:hypothetical protein
MGKKSFLEHIGAQQLEPVIVGVHCNNRKLGHYWWTAMTSDHIIATTTLDTVVAFVIPE